MTSLVERGRKVVRKALRKVFPGHWSFLFGEIAMFSFLVLVTTGLYLALFYDASAETVPYNGSYDPLEGVAVSRAFHSVMDITFERPLGSVVRQTHHWAALVFVAALVLHAARVFFTGAFRRPRRLNWMIGVTLMGLAMATGFFGFVLPHDLLGGTSARIGHAFAVSVPVIGPGVADLLFAGPFGNSQMLHRMWLLHVIVLPILLALLLVGHLVLVWLQTHTATRGADGDEDIVEGSAAWPAYLFKAGGLLFMVLGVLVGFGALVQIAPVWIHGPFDPASTTVPAQPDWYLGWVEGALRIFPSLDLTVLGRTIPSPFMAGVAFPVAVFGVLYAWPFVESWMTGDTARHHVLDRPRHRPVRTALGATGLALLTVLLMAGSHDWQGFLLRTPIEVMTTAYRIAMAVIPAGVGFLTYSVCRSLAAEEARTPLDSEHGRGVSGSPR
ncbi:ubiquinol-cytochrome c reductase cytochrome b subunit [soil metagenome]